MVISSLTPFPTVLSPISNITPFTYSDGATYLEILEKMRAWLNDTLVHDSDAQLSAMLAELQTGLANAETRVALSEAHYDALILEAVEYVTGSILAPAPTGGDDTTSLNAHLAAKAGKRVQLRSGATYKISGTLNIPTGTDLDGNNATIDATGLPWGTNVAQKFGIRSDGSLSTALSVSTPVTLWGRTVSGISSTATLAAGDVVLISNDEQPVPGMTRGDRDKGELAVIASVDTTTQITLATGAMFNYGAVNLQIAKVNPVRNVTIRNLKLTMGGVGSVHNGIEVVQIICRVLFEAAGHWV